MVGKKTVQKARASPVVSNVLRGVPCLSGLETSVLTQLEEETQEERYRRGETIFQEGAVCEEIFLITDGTVKVFRLSDEGRQQTLQILGPGGCFCLAPFFHDTRYPATAQCLTNVRLLRLGGAQCLSLVKDDPRVVASVVQCLCHRVTAMAALLESSSTRKVRRRLVRFLLDIAESRGIRTADGLLLDGGLTHEELAGCVGTAREVVSRALEQLQRKGLVRLGRGRLVLLDLPRLKEIASLHRPAK